MSILTTACQQGEKAVKTGGDATRGVIRAIDPTGATGLAHTSTEAFEALRDRARSVDTDAFNDAVEAIRTLLRRADEKIAQLDLSGIGPTVEDIRKDVGNVRERIAKVEASLTPAIDDIRTLVAHVNERLDQIPVTEPGDTVRHANEFIASVRETTDELPATNAQLKSSLSEIRTASRIASVVLSLFGLCAVTWLVRSVRARRPQT